MKESSGHNPERRNSPPEKSVNIVAKSVNTEDKQPVKSPSTIEVGFAGDHLRFMQELIGKKEPTTSDTLMHALWPDEAEKDPPKAYLKVKRIAKETKEELVGTPLEITSRGGWHGGHSLGKKDAEKSNTPSKDVIVSEERQRSPRKSHWINGRSRRSEADAEFTLPETGEKFYGKHAEFLQHLFNSDTEYTRADSIGVKLWKNKAEDTPLIYSRSRELVYQLRHGLAETDWKIVGKTGKNGGIKIVRKEY